jgi:hypothetical protein
MNEIAKVQSVTWRHRPHTMEASIGGYPYLAGMPLNLRLKLAALLLKEALC